MTNWVWPLNKEFLFRQQNDFRQIWLHQSTIFFPISIFLPTKKVERPPFFRLRWLLFSLFILGLEVKPVFFPFAVSINQFFHWQFLLHMRYLYLFFPQLPRPNDFSGCIHPILGFFASASTHPVSEQGENFMGLIFLSHKIGTPPWLFLLTHVEYYRAPPSVIDISPGPLASSLWCSCMRSLRISCVFCKMRNFWLAGRSVCFQGIHKL